MYISIFRQDGEILYSAFKTKHTAIDFLFIGDKKPISVINAKGKIVWKSVFIQTKEADEISNKVFKEFKDSLFDESV